MIFASVNEKGERKVDKILAMKPKDIMVTSRIMPIEVGKVVAVQPGRGKKSVCKIMVVSCEHRGDHFLRTWNRGIARHWGITEANLEGFVSWKGFAMWLLSHGFCWTDLYRISFVKL